LRVAIRRYFEPSGDFVPFVSGGVGARLVSFLDDDVRGLAFPVVITGGVRAKVHDRIFITGGASLRSGLFFANRGLGLRLQGSLTVESGVEFVLE
jgi:hypothetical protein